MNTPVRVSTAVFACESQIRQFWNRTHALKYSKRGYSRKIWTFSERGSYLQGSWEVVLKVFWSLQERKQYNPQRKTEFTTLSAKMPEKVMLAISGSHNSQHFSRCLTRKNLPEEFMSVSQKNTLNPQVTHYVSRKITEQTWYQALHYWNHAQTSW